MAPTSKDGSRRENCPLIVVEAVMKRERIDGDQKCPRMELEGKFGASCRGNTDSKSVCERCCS